VCLAVAAQAARYCLGRVPAGGRALAADGRGAILARRTTPARERAGSEPPGSERLLHPPDERISQTELPRLRAIDARPITHRGQPAILLRDPLNLTDRYAVLPRRLAPLLALCDGTRDGSGLRASLMVRHGVRLTTESIDQILQGLDEALLFDNARFAEAVEAAVDEYRAAPYRRPISAGASYPAEAGELRAMLQGYLDQVSNDVSAPKTWRGLVSPHIDFARGGPVYARVWKRVEEMARAAELAVIVGTDHSGADGRITLTRQHYATPYGTLPTAGNVVERIAQAIGSETAYADELHHRGEHSIELAAVWLHHMREGKACQVVPILCGSYGRFLRGADSPEHAPEIAALVGALRDATRGRQVLFVAAADLSHVGPAFGGSPADFASRARVQAADDEFISNTCAGDAGGAFRSIKAHAGRYNVCGLAPIYLVLRTLAPVGGERVAYDLCPADEAGASLVTICGVAFE
jgi:AmmeMemoRadiSam system protein B